MLRKRQLLSFSLSLLATLSSLSLLKAQQTTEADNQFTISAQLRPRLEIRDGAFRPLLPHENTAALISERIRLSLNYQYKNQLEISISPQTVGIWGQANMVQGAENSGNRLSLFEAWSKLNLSSRWNIKLGRQVISLDNERFFGELDWAQGGRAHDALSVQYRHNKTDLRGYFAYNQNYKTLYGNNLNNPSGNVYSTADALSYKWMQTLWLGLQLNKQSKLSLLATNLGLQNATAPKDTAIHFTHTVGANFSHQGNKLSANLAAYYQCGKNISGIKTSAVLVAGYIGTQLNKQWQLGLGTDVLTGNDLGVTQTKNKAFNPYFHTGHKFYGSMDYFYAGNGHQNVGLSDTYLSVGFKSINGLAISVTAHQFFTPNAVKSDFYSYHRDLGQEIDVMLSFKINKFSSLSGGYSSYFTTPTLSFLKTTLTAKPYQQWAWVSINVNPTLLRSKF